MGSAQGGRGGRRSAAQPRAPCTSHVPPLPALPALLALPALAGCPACPACPGCPTPPQPRAPGHDKQLPHHAAPLPDVLLHQLAARHADEGAVGVVGHRARQQRLACGPAGGGEEGAEASARIHWRACMTAMAAAQLLAHMLESGGTHPLANMLDRASKRGGMTGQGGPRRRQPCCHHLPPSASPGPRPQPQPGRSPHLSPAARTAARPWAARCPAHQTAPGASAAAR